MGESEEFLLLVEHATWRFLNSPFVPWRGKEGWVAEFFLLLMSWDRCCFLWSYHGFAYF